MKKLKRINIKLLQNGIGNNKVIELYKTIGLNTRIISNKIPKIYLNKIENIIKGIKTAKKLKMVVKNNIDFNINIKNYIGTRHKLRYPVRGQRTHTNAKTKKRF